MTERVLPHLLVPGTTAAEPYRPHTAGGGKRKRLKPADPEAHARALKVALEGARDAAMKRRASAAVSIPGAKPGVCLAIASPPGIPLNLEALDLRKSGIELLSVASRVTDEGETIELATVFVPDQKTGILLKRLDEYIHGLTPKGARKHAALVETLASIQLATLQALWTDSAPFPEASTATWWEVWLRRTDGREEERLLAFAEIRGTEVGSRRLEFPDRVVRTLRATPSELSASIDVLGDLAELRLAREAPATFVKMDVVEQGEWVDHLAARLVVSPAQAPAVCVLDTGVNRGHPLLEPSLDPADLHSVEPWWGHADHHGHGTQMAGLALFGDLRSALEATGPHVLDHRLESSKVLPPTKANPPDLWGAITSEAVHRPEIAAPHRSRVFSMSIAALEACDRGAPTSWSAALDALATGAAVSKAAKGIEQLDSPSSRGRLLMVCAGNVDTTEIDHITRSDLENIRDPAQSWNALTVGACTHLVELEANDRSLKGYVPLAKVGDLSPYSSTSVSFSRAWPIKPDLVFEGGNKVHDGHVALQVEDLSLITTHSKLSERMLNSTWATSAATAQVARIGAKIMAQYPLLSAEAVRALLVHSAEWTPAMRQHVPKGKKRGDRERHLLRRFGFGEPHELRAMKSARNALTLIAEDSVRPFDKGKLREMKIHELPWPSMALLELGETPVQLRVTLSYFIHPNPARRGWRTRYRYASHGLRFDVMRPTESIDEFRRRLNDLAEAEEADEGSTTESDAQDWYLGPTLRHHGSLHSDFWSGNAADLASRRAIGVFPVSGWWKDQPKHDRSADGLRYALVVSINAPAIDVDLWTPVATELGVGIPIAVSS